MSDVKTTTGSLMFMNLDELITKFARFNDLANFSILVVSSEISGALTIMNGSNRIAQNVAYESKYDNIEFVDSLRPPAMAFEHAYNGNPEAFITKYESHLLSAEPFADICAIVEMVVNDGVDVIIVHSIFEATANVHEHLRNFILGEFGIQGYLYSELERLITYHDDAEMYKKITRSIGFEIPKAFDGKDITPIIKNIGDADQIRERLEMQKGIAVSMNADPGKESDICSVFYNRFTEDLESKVRELLLRRSDDDIKDMCRAKGIRITKGASKESLVTKILHEMRLDTKRVKEYSTN